MAFKHATRCMSIFIMSAVLSMPAASYAQVLPLPGDTGNVAVGSPGYIVSAFGPADSSVIWDPSDPNSPIATYGPHDLSDTPGMGPLIYFGPADRSDNYLRDATIGGSMIYIKISPSSQPPAPDSGPTIRTTL